MNKKIMADNGQSISNSTNDQPMNLRDIHTVADMIEALSTFDKFVAALTKEKNYDLITDKLAMLGALKDNAFSNQLCAGPNEITQLVFQKIDNSVQKKMIGCITNYLSKNNESKDPAIVDTIKKLCKVGTVVTQIPDFNPGLKAAIKSMVFVASFTNAVINDEDARMSELASIHFANPTELFPHGKRMYIDVVLEEDLRHAVNAILKSSKYTKFEFLLTHVINSSSSKIKQEGLKHITASVIVGELDANQLYLINTAKNEALKEITNKISEYDDRQSLFQQFREGIIDGLHWINQTGPYVPKEGSFIDKGPVPEEQDRLTLAPFQESIDHFIITRTGKIFGTIIKYKTTISKNDYSDDISRLERVIADMVSHVQNQRMLQIVTDIISGGMTKFTINIADSLTPKDTAQLATRMQLYGIQNAFLDALTSRRG